MPGSGWYELLPPPGPAIPLEGERSADWVIVGAGFAGLAAALRLTRLCPGERIALIDAQRVGWGAAGRNSGFMIDLPHDLSSADYAGKLENDLREIRLHRAAIDFAREAVEAFGLQSCFDPCGKYHGAVDDGGVRALANFSRHLDALGESYESLDAADMRRVTGTDFYVAGIHTPGAVMLQPAAFVRGLADALSDRLTIHENSPVTRIETGPVHTVRTANGCISAPRVILTVNGHAESFGFYRRRLMHVYTFASMTRRLTSAEARRLGGEPSWSLIPAHPMGSTVRRLREARIVVRNTFTYNPDMETDAAQIARLGRRHDRSFRARFPMLADVDMAYRWGGHLCLSRNHVPGFGEVEERLYAAVCQNGLGVVNGTLHGMLIAELATGTKSPALAELNGSDEPAKLPPEPFMSAGARSALWWKHLRAGREL